MIWKALTRLRFSVLYLILILVVLGGVFAVLRWRKSSHRKMLLDSALYDEERSIIADLVPMVARMPADIRSAHEGKVALFLDQVDFYGCEGLQVTDAMRVSIAAQACLLVAGTDAWFETLRTILVYPSAFKSQIKTQDGFVVHEGEQVRLGESWANGPVVLSWAHSKQGGVNAVDGHNLVLHEFAHQLDDLSGHVDGVPILDRAQSYAEWERVFVDAYARHSDHTEQGRKRVLDPYGATNHQEFFAVAVEVFFEKPAQLNAEEPEVYAQLAKLLRLDPASWS